MKHQSYFSKSFSGRVLSLAVLATSFAWMANGQDAKTVLDAAVKAMGVENAGNVRWSGNGLNHAFGQAANPSLPWPKFNVKTYERVMDVDAGGSRVRIVRTQGEIPPHGGGQQPIVGEQTQNQLQHSRDPWGTQAEMWLTPLGFLKGALASGNATVKQDTVGGKKMTVVTFTAQGKYKVNGYIDDQNMLVKADTLIDTPVLGDTLLEAEYSDYKTFGRLKFPGKIVEKEGGFPILDLTVTNAMANVYHVINIPATTIANDTKVVVDEQLVAPGVYYFTGGSHHSAIVEFNNFVVVVDGPLDEARSSAVISEVKKLFIGKPIRYLVNTHQHFDHSGGIRTYAAEGATIITHETNKGYYEKTFAMPRTLNPDKLAQSKKKAVIEYIVGPKRVITDGTRTLELHLAASGHNDGMLIAYLPKEKVLIEADLFTPPAVTTAAPAAAPAGGAAAPAPPPPSPYTLALVDTLDKLKLDYDTILPIHGRLVKKEDLMKAVGRAK
jgi:glyoxylase-like metal-dependent hydrolase (beta-lactamase superfamily II)